MSYTRSGTFCKFAVLLAVMLVVFPNSRLQRVSAFQAETQPPRLEGFAKSQVHMGVQFQISLYATDEEVAEQAFAASFAEIARLERVFSDYNNDSEARRIDARRCETSIELSPDMQRLLEKSLAVNQNTNGYFDVTLGALTKLWRAARREKKAPESEALRSASDRVGSHRLQLSHNQLLKNSPGVELDFGGIAKGDAADQVLSLLKQQFGITRVLIDASGDLVAGDPPPNQPGWVIGLSRPADDPSPMPRVYLANRALASSGDSTQFLEVDRTRWSHLLNPHTKTPIIGQNLTLVWADDGATADALASALAICPGDEFQTIANRFPNVAACVYRRATADQTTEVLQTENWNPTIQDQQVR